MKLRTVLACAGASALIATAAVAATTGGRPWTTIYRTQIAYEQRVDKVCDHGRAVYISTGGGYDAGVGVAVVENAPECRRF